MVRAMKKHQKTVVRDTTARFCILVEYLTCLQRKQGGKLTPCPTRYNFYVRVHTDKHGHSESAIYVDQFVGCASSPTHLHSMIRQRITHCIMLLLKLIRALVVCLLEAYTLCHAALHHRAGYFTFHSVKEYIVTLGSILKKIVSKTSTYLTNSSRSLCTVARFLTSLRRASCNWCITSPVTLSNEAFSCFVWLAWDALSTFSAAE